jgi:hypothetical protein
MKAQKFIYLIAILSIFVLVGCGSTSENKNDKKDKPVEYTVICDNQIIYEGPGEDKGGLVNEVSTEIIGHETYYAVWADDIVKLLEQDGDWVKVKLMSGPNHVTGWIPESCLDK